MLEITEQTDVEDAEAEAAAFRRQLWRRVKLAIGNFGTAFSSLGYSGRWLVDTFKIDHSLDRGRRGQRGGC